jgi:hypothetical protein
MQVEAGCALDPPDQKAQSFSSARCALALVSRLHLQAFQ